MYFFFGDEVGGIILRAKQLTRRVLIAILAATALILRLIEIPMPFAPFLKLDFSELPVMLGVLVSGPIGGVLVAFIRDLLNFLRTGGEMGLPLGAFMSFMGSGALIVVWHWRLKQGFLQKKHWLCRLHLIVGMTISLILVMSILNWTIALPIYTTVINFPVPSFLNFILAFIVPFNAIKGVVIGVLTCLVAYKLKDHLVKREWLNERYS